MSIITDEKLPSTNGNGISFFERYLTVWVVLCILKIFRLTYENATPTSIIDASNHFEVAIATAAMLYGLSSRAALATVVGVLIEVLLMLMLVKFCFGTQNWFRHQVTSVIEESEIA